MRLLLIAVVGSACAGYVWRRNHLKTRDKPFVVGIPGYWGTLLPPLQHSLYGAVVLDNQFETLVRRGNNGLIEPAAAKSWEVSPDYKTVRFKIDTSRRFSDGSFLTAADFKRSWEDGLRMSPKSKNQSVADMLYSIKGFEAFGPSGTIPGIRVLGDDVLELEFSRPARVAVEYLGGVRYAVYKQTADGPIGTGPYVMTEKDRTLSLTPNPFYGGDEPRFQNMQVVVTQPEVMHDSLKSRLVDATMFVEKSSVPECLDEAATDIRCVYSQEADHVAIDVNGIHGRIFGDRNNRLAFQALIHDKLRERGLPPQLEKSRLSLDPQSFLSFQPGRLPDPEAKSIVEQGRAHIPELIKASQKHPVYLVCGRECGWLLSLLRDSGMRLSENSGRTDFTRILEMLYKTSEADLVFGTFSVYNGDPDGLYHILGRNGAIFSPMMDREGISDLLESGREILDRSKMAPHYEKVARAILREVPYVHMGFSGRGVAYATDRARVSQSFVDRNNQRVTLFEPR